ncbi:MAG: O-methyltransferase [Bacteroidota bacterium]|nr:O-methyltransferase [Bacteroidota bacterium]
MDFIPQNITDYALQFTQPESELLSELNRYTHSHMVFPRMLSGHLQGRVLAMFSHMIKPKYILEIGTFTGYSAICLAEGLAPDGMLYTLEANAEYHHIAKDFIGKCPHHNQIQLICADAGETLKTLKHPWDLVFIDADKMNYLNYYQSVIDNVSLGGFIIVDNALWSGKVTDTEMLQKDAETKAIHQFNEYVANDERASAVLLPVRDGMMVLRKSTAVGLSQQQ